MSDLPKALMIFGTRPDAIKMAPVVHAFRRRQDEIKTIVAVTAQHRTQLDQVLDTFQIVPEYDLNVMQHGQSLAGITSRALTGLDDVIKEVGPSVVLAQGDTTTTFVASLAAFYHKVPFGHVEAGLRTDDRYQPFPEEINRRMTAVLADLHFAPTRAAEQRLLSEGIPADRVFLTGNTVIDALLEVASRNYQFEDPRIAEFLKADRVILLTLHRRENLGEPMRRVCRAVKLLIQQFPDVRVIFPWHLNPAVREVVSEELGHEPGVLLVEPQEYVPLVHLMKRSTLVITDSGGIQEEAPSLGKPVLVARETTERPEGVQAGSARLVGTDTSLIVETASSLLTQPELYQKMSKVQNPYGDGAAAERICRHTLDYLSAGSRQGA